MVSTIKFSEFASGGDLANNKTTVGLDNTLTINTRFNNPWTFLASGTTAQRPTPSVNTNYRLRLNTDTQSYEFYDAVSGMWVVLLDTISTGVVLLAPSTDQTIVGAFNLIMATGSMIAPTMLPGNLSLSGNTITSTNSNGNINIIPNGVGATQGITLFGSTTAINADTTSLIQATSVNRAASLSLMTNWNANAGSGIYLSTSRSAIPGTLGAVTSSQILSQINSRGDDGVTGLVVGTQFESVVDGTVSSGIVPGKFNWYTANSSGVSTLGMSLDSAQVFSLVNPLIGSSGGTGVNNGTKTITLGGNLVTSGAFNSTFTMTGATNVTFPTSGTLATTAGSVSSVSGTSNRITSTGGTTPVIDISASYVGQSSITTLGTIGTGVWQGTVIGSTYGGTGVNNGSSTLTLAGNLATSGAFASIFTMTGATNVTFPTSGTLATTASASGIINSGTTNQLAYYAASGTTLSGLSTANNGVLITSGAGVPSISSTLPSAVQGNITTLGQLAADLAFTAPSGANPLYIYLNTDNTFAGTFQLQAGAGSANNGGGLIMYGASHATKPGYVVAGLSSTPASFFTVNNQGTGAGADVFTVSKGGAVVANSSVTCTTLITAPAASQASSLTLGAAYQNPFGYDVVLTVYLAITAATAGTIQIGVGPTNTPTQQTVISGLTLGALAIIPLTIYLPKDYYALVTLTTVTATISGQQAMPV